MRESGDGNPVYTMQEQRHMNLTMRLSFGVGVAMLGIKLAAFYLTHSTAVLSDVAESVVHVLAVGFAAFSMWLSMKPADRNHLYGHDRISFFSAGFEGAMIALAALYIIYQAIAQWIEGVFLHNLDLGLGFVLLAMVVNGLLGVYLLKQGVRYQSLVLKANGKHVLTDCWTSVGVIAALLLTRWTGWVHFDPIMAILVALNILRTGYKLVKTSVGGLMDASDMAQDKEIRKILDAQCAKESVSYHCLRHRNAGSRLLIDFHLLFADSETINAAHEVATRIEYALQQKLIMPAEITTHLEPKEAHDQSHRDIWSALQS